MKQKLAIIFLALVCLFLAVNLYLYQRASYLKHESYQHKGRRHAIEDAERYRDR